MNYAYSPDTGELILTTTPAAWMGMTDVAPPEFNPLTHGCFWRGSDWEIVAPEPVKRERREIISELAALDQKKIRPLAEVDTAYLANLNAKTLALREELRALLD